MLQPANAEVDAALRRPHPVRRSSRPWSLLRLEDRAVPAVLGYAVGSNANAPNQVEVFDNTAP